MKFFKNILTIFSSKKNEIKEISLKISPALEEFVKSEMLPGLNISENYFWSSFENLLNKFHQRNIDLLDTRKQLQAKINEWHLERKDKGLFSVSKNLSSLSVHNNDAKSLVMNSILSLNVLPV